MKNERTFEIENYLAGDMGEAEKFNFEKRLASDPELSSLLHLYRQIDRCMANDHRTEQGRQELRDTLGELTKKYFAGGTPISYADNSAKLVSLPKKRNNFKVLAIAASFLLIIAAYFIFFDKPKARQLADAYIQDNLATLSQTMDGARDSLQQGIAAYNNKEYAKALDIFETVFASHPDNTDALLYAGITSLATGDHEKAITKFTELSSKTNLFSNPGLFLKAVTLLKRNAPGDREEAKAALQQVADQNLENAEEARKMLKSW